MNWKKHAKLLSEAGIPVFEDVPSDEASAFKGKDLPEGIVESSQEGKYLRLSGQDVEIANLALIVKCKYLRTIKNCAVFFVVMSVIGIVAGVLCIALFR